MWWCVVCPDHGYIVSLSAQIVKMGICTNIYKTFCVKILFAQIVECGIIYIRKEGEKMAVSKKQQACVNRYMTNHYDRINLTVLKGNKEIIKGAADAVGLSVNAYINRAIALQLEKDNIQYNAVGEGEE